jgi:hypothetical protein
MSERQKKQSPYTRKFNIMLKVISGPDGGEWTGTKMERATGGKLLTSYFSSLRDGHIAIPRADKIEAIANAMGFPPQLWFKDVEWWEQVYERWEKGEDVGPSLAGDEEEIDGRNLSTLLNRLFELKINDKTGRPFTNEEVSQLSKGTLSVEEVEALREGRLTNPTWAQILALCDVFEVDPSYWSKRRISWRPSPAVMQALEHQESFLIFQNSLRLSPRDRSMLRILSDQMRREGRKGVGEEPES